MLRRHGAVRKDTHERRPCCRENYETLLCLTATARRNFWRSDTTRHKPKLLEIASRYAHHCMCPMFHCMCPGRRGQKRHAQSALVRCASLHVSRFSRWHTRAHCHLCHAGTSGICEASARSACHWAASARAACRCRISVWIQSGWKWQHSSKRFRYSRRSNSSSVRFTWGHSLWSRKIFKMVTASADAFAERATWQDFLPGSAEAVSLHPAADEFYYGTCASTQGCAHIARKPRRSKIRHAISLARWLHALAYSTWRAGDAVRKGTQSEQARLSGNRSPTHEMASRLSHATQNPLFADTSSVVNGQDMSSTTTCLHETTWPISCSITNWSN